MSKRKSDRRPKRNAGLSHCLDKELSASRKLRAYRSFQRTHPNVYEKCRHFRRG